MLTTMGINYVFSRLNVNVYLYIRAIIEHGLIDKKISKWTFVSDAIFFNSTDGIDMHYRPVNVEQNQH